MNTEDLRALEKEIERFLEIVKNLDKISISNQVNLSKEAKEVNSTNISHHYQSVVKEIKKRTEHLAQELITIKSMEWKQINIALFGETNAGKSTLIEAITHGNGKSIGDGRKDFTKNIIYYQLSSGITLMDVPGIEGNEKEIIKELRKALKLAHIILYVYPDTKEPERETLKKIKMFLRKNAEVYSVLNVRGIFPPEVLNKKMEKSLFIKQRTDKQLQKLLGDTYKGSFLVHALFGFFSRAESIPSNLKEKYKTAIRLYSSREKLLEYSKLEDILFFIENLPKNREIYELKILWGNFRKILTIQEEILAKILHFKKRYDQNIENVNLKLNQVIEKFKREKVGLKNNIKKVINTKLEVLEVELKQKVYESIEKKESTDLKGQIKHTLDKFKAEIKTELEEEINDFKGRIIQDIDTLQRNIAFLSSVKSGEVALDSILEKLNYSLFEIGMEIVDVIFSIYSVITIWLINPIIGILTGLAALARKIWNWFFSNPEEKKSQAKREANKRIEKNIHSIKKEIEKKLSIIFKEIEKQFRKNIEQIKIEEKNLKRTSRIFDKVIARLIEINNYTAFIFIRQIDPNIQFAYIQTRLKEGTSIAIVTQNPYQVKYKLEKLGIENIFLYSSFKELQADAASKDSEFFKRLRRAIPTNPNFLNSDH